VVERGELRGLDKDMEADVQCRHFPNEAAFPPLIPILIGSTTQSVERRYGALLSPYLADPSSIFIISSDFCHWGLRFRYTHYQPPSASSPSPAYSLRSSDRAPSDYPIHQSIAAVDKQCMDACETGDFETWWDALESTGNTVCGRHPIGIFMAAVEALEEMGELVGEDDGVDGVGERLEKGKFRFVRYERSSRVTSVRDSSVSYCSAFAVF
jgi:MEMO1 family protein